MNLWRRIFATNRRVLVPLIGALIVNVVVLVLAVLPLRKVVTNATEAAAQASLDRNVALKHQADAKAVRASRDRAEQDLQKFYSDVLPKDFDAAVSVTYLDIARIAQSTGLQSDHRQFDPVRVKNSRLAEFKTDATLEGDYLSVKKFLYQLETAEPFLIIESVALAPAKSLKVDNGQLQVTVSIATYYLSGGS